LRAGRSVTYSPHGWSKRFDHDNLREGLGSSVPTIADVARAAGVSTSTVSYVLSGRRPISPATRARVEASIAALGYRPHAGARALASRHTNVLALVAPLRTDINVPVIMQFVTSVVTEARRYDHDVLLLTKDEGTAGLDRVAGGGMVDALIRAARAAPAGGAHRPARPPGRDQLRGPGLRGDRLRCGGAPGGARPP
jgi:transcriptional regulator with XRE-family HTH domain